MKLIREVVWWRRCSCENATDLVLRPVPVIVYMDVTGPSGARMPGWRLRLRFGAR